MSAKVSEIGAARFAVAPVSPAKSDRGGLIALVLAPMLGVLTFVAAPSLFSEMADDLDVSVTLLGQVIAAMFLLGAPLSLVFGPLADRHGPRRVLVFGALCSSICLVGFGVAPSLPVLLLAACVGSAGIATLTGLSMAVAGTAYEGPARRWALGCAAGGAAGASIAGVPALTAISGTFGWRTAFVAAGFGGLAVVWLIGTRLPGVERWPSRSMRGESMMRAYRVLLGHRPTARLLTAVALRAVGWSGLLTYVGSVVTDAPGLGEGLVGPIYALGAGGYILGSLLAGRLLERISPGVAAPVSAAVQAILIGCSASAVLGPVGTMAIQPLMGFAAAIGMVGMSLLLMTGSPAGTGSTMALNVALGNLGMALGGALGGVLLAWGGRNGLGVGLAVCVLAAAGMARNGTNRAARPGSSTVSAT